MTKAEDKFNAFNGGVDNTFDDDDNEFDEKENMAPDVAEDEIPKELPITIKLKRPFRFGTIDYTEITFKFPITVGMMRAMPASEELQKIGHQLPLISGMTGEPMSVIEMLSPADFGECTKIVTRFF